MLRNQAAADVDILASEPQDDFSVSSVASASQSSDFSILARPQVDDPPGLDAGLAGGGGANGFGGFYSPSGVLPGGSPFTSPLWKPGLGGTFFAAWEIASEEIREKFVDLFHQACRILPNPFPSPSLFPTPTPTPPHENNCDELAIPESELIQEGTLQPGENPKINGQKRTLLILMDADFEKAKSDFKRLIGPDCEPETKGQPPKELEVVQFSDGTNVNLREFSSSGEPIIEIQYPKNSDGTKNVTKFRYNP